MKKVLVALMLVSALISLPFALMASDLPEGAPPNAVRPSNGICPLGYNKITYNMGFISMQLCIPVGSQNGPTPPPNGGQTPPPPPDPNNGTPNDNPPALGSPPSAPDNPQGFSQPPRGEQNRALQEKPRGLSDSFMAVRRNNLYFYYRGRYTSRASTYLGRWLPVYVKLPRGGNLRVLERYYNSGRIQRYNWGYRPAGWTKFWFYADTRGWHALISNTNGAWGNWIWVYVY